LRASDKGLGDFSMAIGDIQVFKASVDDGGDKLKAVIEAAVAANTITKNDEITMTNVQGDLVVVQTVRS